MKYSDAFVVLPGGYGTLDELFETLTLIQTGKVDAFPVVPMGEKYWEGLRSFIRDTLIGEGTISPEDLELVQPTDDVDDALRTIKASRRGR